MQLGDCRPTLLLSIPQAMTMSPPHRPSRSDSGGTFIGFAPKPGCDHKFLGR